MCGKYITNAHDVDIHCSCCCSCSSCCFFMCCSLFCCVSSSRSSFCWSLSRCCSPWSSSRFSSSCYSASCCSSYCCFSPFLFLFSYFVVHFDLHLVVPHLLFIILFYTMIEDLQFLIFSSPTCCSYSCCWFFGSRCYSPCPSSCFSSTCYYILLFFIFFLSCT